MRECSPTDAEGNRDTLEFCASLNAPLAGGHEPSGESITSPATVAALAQNFGGSAQSKVSQVRPRHFIPMIIYDTFTARPARSDPNIPWVCEICPLHQ